MLTVLIPEERVISSFTSIAVVLERGGLTALTGLGVYKWVRSEYLEAKLSIRRKEQELVKKIEEGLK